MKVEAIRDVSPVKELVITLSPCEALNVCKALEKIDGLYGLQLFSLSLRDLSLMISHEVR
jgi:hypothetical protein